MGIGCSGISKTNHSELKVNTIPPKMTSVKEEEARPSLAKPEKEQKVNSVQNRSSVQRNLSYQNNFGQNNDKNDNQQFLNR